MANTYGNPITLNTVMASGYQSTIGAVAGNRMPVFPQMIVWHAAVTVGDTFTIVDPISNLVLFQGMCSVAKQAQTFVLLGRPWSDFKLSQISSGTVQIYC